MTPTKLTTESDTTMSNVTGTSSCVLYYQGVSRHAGKVLKKKKKYRLFVRVSTKLAAVACFRLTEMPECSTATHEGKICWRLENNKTPPTDEPWNTVTTVCISVCEKELVDGPLGSQL